MRNTGKGSIVMMAEASEVYKSPIIRGLKSQVKELTDVIITGGENHCVSSSLKG